MKKSGVGAIRVGCLERKEREVAGYYSVRRRTRRVQVIHSSHFALGPFLGSRPFLGLAGGLVGP